MQIIKALVVLIILASFVNLVAAILSGNKDRQALALSAFLFSWFVVGGIASCVVR